MRYAPLVTETYGVTLAVPSSEAGVVAAVAAEALGLFTGRRPVRLLGVCAEFVSLTRWGTGAELLAWSSAGQSGSRPLLRCSELGGLHRRKMVRH